MVSNLIKVSLFSLGIMLNSHCRHNPAASELEGGKVNNGPGPVGDILLCTNDDKNARDLKYFTLKHTTVVTLNQGVLSKNKQPQPNDGSIFFYCKAPISNDDEAANLRRCDEARNGDQLWHADIKTDAKSGKTKVEITLDQMFPAPPKKMATMTCNAAK